MKRQDGPALNDRQYLQHCRQLLSGFAATLLQRTEALDREESLRELARAFGRLATGDAAPYRDGPALVSRLFTTFPDFAPTFPRELLWFFGGDCLHYMPDEEIELFQQLEDLRGAAARRGEVLDLRAARANLLKLQ